MTLEEEKAKYAEAIRLLKDKFGEEAEYYLWERTCYPFSAETCLEQAKELVATDGKSPAPDNT